MVTSLTTQYLTILFLPGFAGGQHTNQLVVCHVGCVVSEYPTDLVVGLLEDVTDQCIVFGTYRQSDK